LLIDYTKWCDLMRKKYEILLIAIIILSSAALTSSFASGTASGSVNYSPSVFSSGTTTLTDVNGGTFGVGSTVYFYISTTTTPSGIIGGYAGYYVLPARAATLSNAHVQLAVPTIPAGQYYLIASDSSSPTSSGAQFTFASTITVTSLRPSVSVSGSQPTTSASVSGSGWDPSSSVSLYIAGGQGSPIFVSPILTFTTTSSGSVSAGTTFTIPEIAYGSYIIVAQESSPSSSNNGITADSSISVSPIVSVSPFDISGSVRSQFTVYGYGFPSMAAITANGISVGSVRVVNDAVTASTTGSFSVSASLSTAITSSGFYTVSVAYNSTSYSQSGAILVSIPNPLSLGLEFTTQTSQAYPNSQYTANIYNFPAGVQVLLTLGPSILGNITTDSNGYATLSGAIPPIPGGTYDVVASSSGLYASVSVIVSSYFIVIDPDGIQMISTNEYFPSTGHYTVESFGLNPLDNYTFNDSAASSSAVIDSVSSGSIISGAYFKFSPASNGTLIFTFSPNFSPTATESVISLTYSQGSVSGFNNNKFGYTAVQSPYFSFSRNTVSIWQEQQSETVTVSGIIPAGSTVYPGLETSYNIYVGTIEASFTTGSARQPTTVLSSTSSSISITLISPSAGGLYYVGITCAGQPVSNALYSAPVLVSCPASTLDSGQVQSIPIHSGNQVTGYYIVGYSFYPSATVKLYYYTQTSLYSSTEGLTYGGFLFTMTTLPSEPSGTYRIFAEATYQSSTYVTYSNYTVYPSFVASNGGSYSATINTAISFSIKGFLSNTYYSIYFGNYKTFTGATDSGGSGSGSFNIPIVMPGKYNITVIQLSDSNEVATEQFNVTPSPTLTVRNYAFPGQLVSFSWRPSTAPSTPSTPSGVSPYYGSIYTTVYLNGSAFYTTVASFSGSYINGSFVMPNDPVGSYWGVTLSWQQDTYSTKNASTTTTTSFYGMSASHAAILQLVNGSGATITGISRDQIAEITAAVSSSISASMELPLSELNATISSINNSTAFIRTSFGTMESSLSALNASIASVNGTVVTLNTSIGKVDTSLSSLNASIATINGSTAKIMTSIGTITGNITAIKNNVATIRTSLGVLTVNLGNVSGNLNNVINYGLIFDVLLIALVAVTLAIAIMGLLGTRDIKRRFGMKKE